MSLLKTTLLVIAYSFFALAGNATNYYVDAVNGNNSYSGTSSSQAFATIQTAANLTNPGDTVFIMNGVYTNPGTVLNVTRSGDASGQIVYTAYPGHSPKLKASITTYNVVTLGTGVSYITINGLEVEGYGVNLSLAADTIPAKAQVTCPVAGSASTSDAPLNKYNGNGISSDSRSMSVGGSHHLVITNNTVHDNGGGGIAVLKSDYVIIEGNTVYNNAWYAIYGNSGITFNDFYNYDGNTTTYRNIVRNNTSCSNRMYVPWRAVCKITDGNGIILDIPTVGYNGKTLVTNNLVFNNGGSGIHAYKMSYVDIVNNTAYYNSASPEISGGEIYANATDGVNIYNNILVARPGKKVNSIYNSTNLVYNYNLYWGGSSVDVVGTNSVIQDPKFVNPSTDPTVADFHLQKSSPAINAGYNSLTYASDKNGAVRPTGPAVDMGIFETSYTQIGTNCNVSAQNKVLGSGSGTGEPGAGSYLGPYDSRPASGDRKSRRAMNYPQALLNGIPSGAAIASLQFRRAVQSGSTQTVPDNSIINIYLRNEASDNFGSADFDWTTILLGAATPATLVYGGDANRLVGTSGGWQTVPFQVPFTYTGANLGVFVEYLQKGSISSAPDVLWVYDNGGSQPLYNTTTYPNQLYATKTISTTGVMSNSLNGNNERRPVMTVGYCTSLVVLPVNFVSMNAVKAGGSVRLDWQLAAEVSNESFDVQRSVDGVRFETLGFVRSKAPNGNSTQLTEYSFIDTKPLTGKNIYRLAQNDKDGHITYSKTVSVNFQSGNLNALVLYPSPVRQKLNVAVVSETNLTATVSITDVSGRVITTVQKRLQAGNNTFDLDLSKCAASTYVLQVVLPSGERLIQKFLKVMP